MRSALPDVGNVAAGNGEVDAVDSKPVGARECAQGLGYWGVVGGRQNETGKGWRRWRPCKVVVNVPEGGWYGDRRKRWRSWRSVLVRVMYGRGDGMGSGFEFLLMLAGPDRLSVVVVRGA